MNISLLLLPNNLILSRLILLHKKGTPFEKQGVGLGPGPKTKHFLNFGDFFGFRGNCTPLFEF